MDQTDGSLQKLRYLIVGLLVVVIVGLLLTLFSTVGSSNAEASRLNPSPDVTLPSLSGSPNVVADGLARATDSFNASLTAIDRNLQVIGSSFTQSKAAAARQALSSTSNVLRSAGRDIGGMGYASARGFVFLLRMPGNALGYLGNTRLVSAVIRPSTAEHEPVPIIDPNSPDLFAARAALPATPSTSHVSGASPHNTEVPMWPIHGAITTEFGASDWPYQTVHTGIDISDGQRPGVTPVHPFRSGRIIMVIHSSISLGNHIVVDHGNGVTSVYGHLAFTSVQIGQQVDQATVLGYEGTTGASTGTHLHFEIRVNGQAANPHQFIAGLP